MITSITDFNLKPYNTFGMDVKCSRWIEYTTSEDLYQLPPMIGTDRFINIGGGSNLLFLGDFDGCVLHSRILDVDARIDAAANHVLRVGSGVVMDELIEQCASSGIWGMENLSGIPGEVGASAVQNVGAYGVEAADFITKVECYDMKTGAFRQFDVSECGYGYRTSVFKEPDNKERFIITYVTFCLKSDRNAVLEYGNLSAALTGCELTPMSVRNAVMAMRNAKLPSVSETGSAGSYFKNPIVSPGEFERIETINREMNGADSKVPHFMIGDSGVKVPAAWLIDQCGLKGYSLGNASVWHLQPLVIVNATGKAHPDEIVALERHVIGCVKNKFGIELHPEVEHI